ncbi:hypothetical protein [Allorhizobium undicola]|uniref:hypothetical protein n=1 Tax=Allorhizobium undicola TaxID=78527 RepID=UPI000481AB71|nr:hypothetical protein [Allorhizobium undicola]
MSYTLSQCDPTTRPCRDRPLRSKGLLQTIARIFSEVRLRRIRQAQENQYAGLSEAILKDIGWPAAHDERHG